ncbi:uncharacterized protein K460DRAFT_270540 [Cucurbitaria berberidis CBS 394.84]|uniref:Uncharacterized protein n=1 Tax=Cucurbitaria berberidis CBS 394.84 TaxID=1168544 RepID=A0A9P4LE90_9PLEO|nr:uncharacterized protein K460DRAFT_270540 [Cucurbitaria berberidis CBS 394.84]KAF1851618.1 hypothetical protein K460DRAFT_270540 [Cucurbitaria berberidis CBS 394.84]
MLRDEILRSVCGPSTSPDPIERLLEEDLETAWHFQREAVLRNNLKIIWSPVDSYLTVLKSGVFPTHRPCRDMFNKPTAFYFEQSAQCGRYDNIHGYPCIQRIFIASMFEAWRARCGDMLNIEFGHFLANPVRITKQGPQTLGEIAVAHRALCDMAQEKGVGDVKHKILESYPVIILICDQEIKTVGMDEDGLINLRKLAEEMTVLVMHTGTSLPSPITLEGLEPHALPLDRSDAHGIEVRRVPIKIAVDFIVGLENRTRGPQKEQAHEYDSDLCRHEVPDGFDRIVKNDPKMWVPALMASAMRKGYDSLKDTREAIQRIEARAAGVSCDFDFEHEEWSRHWKSGYDVTLCGTSPMH